MHLLSADRKAYPTRVWRQEPGAADVHVGCSIMPLDLEARIVVNAEWNSGEASSNGDADTGMWCVRVVALA
jgi:hypothetical protein